MNKLMLLLLLCLWTTGSDAHKMGLRKESIMPQRNHPPEALELFNPLLIIRN